MPIGKVASIHRAAEKVCSRKVGFRCMGFSETRPRAMGNDKAPGLFTEGFYRYSVFSTSLDVSNHHLNLLLALRFIFALEIAWSLYAFSL
jgi:hypothetical protein